MVVGGKLVSLPKSKPTPLHIMQEGLSMASKTIREAVAVFPDAASLEDAIDELRSSGFDRPEISLLAAQGTVDEKLGHIYERVSDLEDDPSVPRTAYISTESRGDAEGGLVVCPIQKIPI
jgi:hypothetical protein